MARVPTQVVIAAYHDENAADIQALVVTPEGTVAASAAATEDGVAYEVAAASEEGVAFEAGIITEEEEKE